MHNWEKHLAILTMRMAMCLYNQYQNLSQKYRLPTIKFNSVVFSVHTVTSRAISVVHNTREGEEYHIYLIGKILRKFLDQNFEHN